MPKDYSDCYEYLSAQFSEVGGCEFYRELFPDNENAGEIHTDFSHPNAIYLYRDESAGKERRRIMLDDTWEQDYMDYVEQNPLTLCSGLVYRKRANKLQNAQRMNALIFDLDGVGGAELRNLFLRFGGEPERLRRPAYADFSCFVRHRTSCVLCFPGAGGFIPEYQSAA